MSSPIIAFGQQPNGFFPKRYLYAKIETARRLQKEIGGRIVFFYHDSDADYKETITTFIDPETKKEVRLNFLVDNKIEKKYSPLYIKKIAAGWQEDMIRKLPRYVDKRLVEMFASVKATTVADFCLSLYEKMGLLDGIEVVRSSDRDIRMNAIVQTEYYADVSYEGEIVRAELHEGALRLHEGGGNYFTIPMPQTIEKWQKNPGREERFAWMQSVLHATHYVSGVGEGGYLKKDEFPDVTFVERDAIDQQDLAYIPTTI